ncbi:M50 family metallopeptidase [Alicyclobacillus herbarius]|uniref:M50 family metallopeptidase n=1 Tax=Alicyclobacillus herbarius TaxID=122960 RepID=UPI00041B7192|nr:M50 family metallopeptidase [Alicyclobacillus herbarius]
MTLLSAAMLMTFLKSAVAIVLVFLVCIVLHEFGHFIVAKRCGVAVPQFAVGFGTKLFKWHWGDTEFSVRLWPLGGLVQLAGEVPQDALFRKGEEIAFRLDNYGWIAQLGSPKDVRGGQVGVLRELDLVDRMQMTIETHGDIRTYQVRPYAELQTSPRNSIPLVEKHEQMLGRPLWQRAAIILAGPVMNFLLAGVLFAAYYTHTGILVNQPTLGPIVAGSPAQAAGLKQGDRVIRINGHPVTSWVDMVEDIQSDPGHPPQPIRMEVVRNGQPHVIVVHPQLSSTGVPQIGVNNPVTHNPIKTVASGFSAVYFGSVNMLSALGNVFVHHQFQDLAGPVGIADVISQQAQNGFWQVVMIAGLLSLNLGLFNLLPIPALDGGRLLFMLIEAVRGRAIDPNKEGLVHLVGFALLMLFAVVITYRDVTRLF